MSNPHNAEGHIRLYPHAGRVRVMAADTVIADTRKAMKLDENGYPARFYIPREDIVDGRLCVAEKRTHCPFKGDATYHDVLHGDTVLTDAAWSYDAPFAAMTDITGHVAFDHAELTIDC